MKKVTKFILNFLPARIICKLEYDRQTFQGFNERPIEFGFVFNCIGKLYPKKVLDVGTGMTALPHLIRNCGPLVKAIDNIKDYWPSGMSNRHFHVLDGDITASSQGLGEKFDLVTCISVLEHIKDHDRAIENMFKLLNPGGHLVLTCPYTESQYCEDVYQLNDSNAKGKSIPFVCQSYSREKLDRWIEENNGEIIEQQVWQYWDGDFWSTGNKIIPPIKANTNEKHQLSCLLIKKIA